MGPVDALKIALSKEIESLELYQKFAYEHPAAKEIFIFLGGGREQAQGSYREENSRVNQIKRSLPWINTVAQYAAISMIP